MAGSSTGPVKGRQMGWLRHVLTVLSVLIFMLGCLVIGYMAWVLATSVTVARFVDGEMFWTYSVITLGFSLFFSGLLGWVGGASESPCLVRLFLAFIVLSLLIEVGGIITLNILGQSFGDILEMGWHEVNQGTRNIVQESLSCCGWRGLDEFRNNEPIDESCYEKVVEEEVLAGLDGEEAPMRMKQEPCMNNLQEWFLENKITWVTMLAVLAAVQVMCVGIAVYILQRVSRLKKLRAHGKRKLYGSEEDRRFMGRM